MAQNHQRLPPKESAIFKTVVKMYETKQYKKGIKNAEVILKKFPNHGETLAMKGLILNCLNKKEEGYQFVRLGLKNDMTSHVCWHVYGLLYRSDKNYNEAIKCYRNALKHDPDNLQILRDLSLLQIQMRDLEGYRTTRMDLLKTRPTQRPSWIGLAMAYHLMDHHELALNVLEAFEETLKKGSRDDSIAGKYEQSEMTMYKISIVAEAGDFERAIKLLEESEKSVVDKEAFKELKADTLARAGRTEDAEEMYRSLLKNNSDCRAYYLALEKLKEGRDLVDMYLGFRKEFPRAHFPRRRLLDVSSGDVFRAHADEFLQNFLRKGAPSLFSMVLPLYNDKAKVAIIQELVEGYYAEYFKSGRFADTGSAPIEAPSARLWLEFFMSKHYNRVGNLHKALELVELALGHTPTCIELYLHKAKIFKHLGDPKTAADLLNEARELDTADRYLNSKCVKYMLRADRVSEAEETVGLFTREGVDQVDNLQEMQCMWFEQCSGDSFVRQGKMGAALKRFHQVEKHFADITDDQFDFHTYCMRKTTLRAYIRLLRLEDHLRGHKFYRRAAHKAIHCYLRLADKPAGGSAAQDQSAGSEETAGLSEKELKKLRSKMRREQARAQSVKEEPKGKAADETKKGKKAQDTDPEGQQLANVADPLAEAVKFLVPLLTLAKDDINTHLAAARIYMRKKRYLLVLRALKAAKAIDAGNAELHHLIISFNVAVGKAELNAHVRRVVEEELKSLLDNRAAAECSAEYISSHVATVPALVEAVLARYELDPSSAEDGAAKLMATAHHDVLWADEANATFLAIRDGLKLSEKAQEYKTLCAKKLPHALWCRA